ncbi:MAG: type A chloramphenicol O-acetyltransferase [Bacillota bacterium]
MGFNLVDIDNWERREYFHHYMTNANCTHSITANLDITTLAASLKRRGLRIYPTVIYMVSRVVNHNRNFRFTFDSEGHLGYWDTVSAEYPIFHDDDQTFSYIYTDYNEDFPTFYRSCVADMLKYGDLKGITTKSPPPNSFTVSCIPWVSFTGFNLNILTEGRYLSPIITWGKFFEQGGRQIMPISVQVHHAVADGYHTGKLLNDLQYLADHPDEWLGAVTTREECNHHG